MSETELINEGGVSVFRGTQRPPSGVPVLTSVTVPISSAQLLACHSTPVELVPAPGLGRLLVPTYVLVSYRAGSSPYVSNNEAVDYSPGTDGVLQSNGIIISEATDQLGVFPLPWSGQVFPAAGFSAVVDASLVFAAPVADPTGGDGTVTVTVQYFTATL